ncbi:MAG TPA: FAD-binding oxidoreductase [Ktedonobacterales bacterium]|nr:FAD-binding oxidoreductase [Ktedonobacterales bacterium]
MLKTKDEVVVTVPVMPAELTNWSRSERSVCSICKPGDGEEIVEVLAAARARGLSVVPHGAGHSYTDAALNTDGVVIDVTGMRRILSWNPEAGIMRVEPGATLRDVVSVALPDGWWPAITPSTPDVTIGGCVAMNVTGKNAWKCGSFGEYVLAMDVVLATGEARHLTPERDAQLFQAFVGSAGLLGIITAITLRLRRVASDQVTVRTRSAGSLDEILAVFAEEAQASDFLEAWIDGFAAGRRLGRGQVSCATLRDVAGDTHSSFPIPNIWDRMAAPAARMIGNLCRPTLMSNVRVANEINNWWGRQMSRRQARQTGLIPYTYYPAAALAGYPALLPQGIETFQAFVPHDRAREIFAEILQYSQKREHMPIWCIVKQHRRDPFLLSYQVDGYSLELNYRRTRQTAQALERALQRMIAIVIDAGGRLYLAKDHFLTHTQYRRSVGSPAIDAFLHLKRQYDPDALLQSNLFRRVFQSSDG